MEETYWLRYRGVRFPLRLGETILGRSPYCAVVIPDSDVSRTHATVRLTAHGPEIQDLNSSNGTEVNGERIVEAVLLGAGDVVVIGNATLEVVTTAPESFSDTNRAEPDATGRSTLPRLEAVRLIDAGADPEVPEMSEVAPMSRRTPIVPGKSD